jgi:hypothetical protein
MGYYTDFEGGFKIEPPLAPKHEAYLKKFFETRRMVRDVSKAASMPDPEREAVGLPIGEEGEFFTGGLGYYGQGEDPSIVDHNREPKTQHGLWCAFEIEDGHLILKSGKNYCYHDWLAYLIEKFFVPWGYKLNGSVRWRGESFDDIGKVDVIDNTVVSEEVNW